MKTQLTLALCALLAWSTSYATEALSPRLKELESASARIGSHIDRRAVTNSLYRQMRPHVLITNKKLKASEIDKQVRTYIDKKYTPVLLMNYSLLFGRMKKAHDHFSSCSDKLQPFDFTKNTQIALCTANTKGNIHVRYMMNEHRQGWEKTSEFVFRHTKHGMTLVAILLNLKKGQKLHVDGI